MLFINSLIDVSLEIMMEKVLLVVKVLKGNDVRIAKRLLVPMLRFCSQVSNICIKTFKTTLEVLFIWQE